MITQLTDYGWRILDGSCDIVNNQLVFSSGTIIHESDNWDDIEISANFLYKGSDNGIILCYNYRIGYLLFSVSTSSCKMLRVPILNDDGTSVTIGQARVLQSADLQTPLLIDTTYNLKVVRNGNNIKCYIDDTQVLNIEESLYKSGSIGLYGGNGEICTGINVQSLFSITWVPTGMSDGDSVSLYKNSDGNSYINIKVANESTDIVGVKQQLSVISGRNYTVQCICTGNNVNISFAGTEVSDALVSGERSVITHTFTATSTTHDLVIGTKVGELIIEDVQVEDKSYQTSYVYNASDTLPLSRLDASLSYPSNKNIDIKQGSVSLWFKPMMNYTDVNLSSMPVGIFYYGDDEDTCIRIYYDGVMVRFQYGNSVVSESILLEQGELYYIAATWDMLRDTGHLDLFVVHNDDIVDPDNIGANTLSGAVEVLVSSGTIDIGGDSLSRVCNAVIDNLIIYNRALSYKEIYNLFISDNEPTDTEDMMLRANFNNGIGNFNWSTIDITPAPLPGTPVIVKKSDGTIMRKVSFTDPVTNKYVPCYRQVFTYNGGTKVAISIEDADFDFYNTGIYTLDGIKLTGLTNIDTSAAERSIKLLTALEDKYIGQQLEIWYQPKDCYVVDFNTGENDVCRITLGKNDGKPITIIYEPNRYIGDYALAETIELNALNNPNNQGFMYITQSVETAGVFRVNVSPDEIVANGFNYAVIVTEIVDEYGNPVSNADYEFMNDLQYGTIERYHSESFLEYIKKKEEYISSGHTEDEWYENYGHYIGLNEQAGRQIFLYKANRLKPSNRGSDEVTERIIIRDKVSGLGTEISIRLIIKSDYKLAN
jgi:hypothetical protein